MFTKCAKLILLPALLSLNVACGGGGGGGGGEDNFADPRSAADVIAAKLDIPGAIERDGELEESSPLDSAPELGIESRSLLTTSGSEQTLSLNVEVAEGSALAILLAKVAGSSGLFELAIPESKRLSRQVNGKLSVLAEFALKIDPSLLAEAFCLDVQAQDDAQRFSAPLRLCFALPENNPAGPQALANAGVDQEILSGSSVQFVGSGTSPNGTIASFSWAQIAGPDATLSGTDGSILSVTAPQVSVASRLVFKLQVIDSLGNTAEDEVDLLVLPIPAQNTAPVAEAGSDQRVEAERQAVLRGDDFDLDGEIVQRGWVQLSGPSVNLMGAASNTARFVAPRLEADTPLELEYAVIDDDGATASDTASVTVLAAGAPANQPPVANAGTDQTVAALETVTLSGGRSTDPDGSIASFSWSQIAGTSVELSGAATAVPNFVAPEEAVGETLQFRLSVTDNAGASASDDVAVLVASATQFGPSASAGPDQTVAPGAEVNLDGRDSFNPGSGELDFFWTQIGGPDVVLSDPESAVTQFTAPSVPDGSLLSFHLTVTLEDQQSSDQVEITIAEPVAVEPEINFGDASLAAEESAGTVNIALSVNPVADSDIILDFTVGGTAVLDSDFSVTGSPLRIPAGASAAAIVVTIIDDADFEEDETVILTLGEPSGAVIGDVSQHVLSIRDNEDASANGVNVVAVTDEYRLLQFNSNTPSEVQALEISGLEVIDDNNSLPLLIDMDFRPATGELYLFTSDQRFYIIDTSTGEAALRADMAQALGSAEFNTMKFDPCTDEVRLLGSARENIRVSANGDLLSRDTNVAFAAGEGSDGSLSAAALAFSACSAGQTTAFVLESDLDLLTTLGSRDGSPESPSGGQLFTVGELGVAVGGASAPRFDIDLATGLALVSDINGNAADLFSLNLDTGEMVSQGIIQEGDLRTAVISLTIEP